MKRRTLTIVSIVSIIIISLLLLSLTYGYYLTTIEGNTNSKSVEVVTGDTKVLYTDLSQDNTSEIIKPGFKTVKSFTVQNIGNVSATYSIYLVDVINSFNRTQDITYNLYKKVGTITDVTIATDLSETNGWSRVNTTENVTFPTAMSVIAPNEIIETPNQIYTYVLKVEYIDHPTENQNENQGKTFAFKVNLRAEDSETNPFSEGTLAYNIINRATSSLNDITLVTDGSVESRVANQASTSTYGKTNPTSYPQEKTNVTTSNTYTYASDYTIDANGKFTLVNPQTLKYSEGYETLKGKYIVSISGSSSTTAATSSSISTIYKVSPTEVTANSFNYISVNKYVSTEKVMATTVDDYGTSYYYRGGVENNYVTFANKCWRIVRIAGDGSVKLVLEDQDEPCSTSMNGNWNIPVSNAEGASTSGNFGYTVNANDQYLLNYLNGDSSSMASAFKNFQTTELSSYLSDLKEGEWCLADKAYASSSADVTTATPLTEAEKQAIQAEWGSYYYDSYVRLMGNSTKQPTLKCNGTKMDKFADKTTMYVGALTADEIVYAGAAANWNYAYYLLNDYQRGLPLHWWALSPVSFDDYIDSAFSVNYYGNLNGSVGVSRTSALRPSVSLKSSTGVVAGGEGTLAKPYVVNSQAN